jgi:hypothetical protein
VHTQLVSSGAWYSCSEDSAASALAQAAPGHDTDTVWDCPTTTPQLTITAQDQVRIVAHT